jgi:hypothetical protein
MAGRTMGTGENTALSFLREIDAAYIEDVYNIYMYTLDNAISLL